MNDEPTLHHFDPMPEPPPPKASPELKRLLRTIPARADEHPIEDTSAEIGAVAAQAAAKRSEARRDAVLAVSLAIKRRGDNPLTDWTTKDVDTAYAIADQLAMLETT